MNMSERNKTAMYIAISAGVMLLIAGITGVAFIEKIRDFAKSQFNNEALNLVFVILIFLAALGGILVMLGGILIGKNKVGLGKVLITIGVGTGLIGLIMTLYVLAVQKTMDTSIGGIFGLIGIILSVVARMMAKKDDSPQQATQYASPQQQYYPPQPSTQQYPVQNTPPQQYQPVHQQPASAPVPQPPVQKCPTCGTPYRYIQQYNRNYCDVCGKYQ